MNLDKARLQELFSEAGEKRISDNTDLVIYVITQELDRFKEHGLEYDPMIEVFADAGYKETAMVIDALAEENVINKSQDLMGRPVITPGLEWPEIEPNVVKRFSKR